MTNAQDMTVAATYKHRTTKYSTLDIFSETHEQNTVFIGAIDQDASLSRIGIGFGLDTSLTTTPGWDNATGYGTPQDALAFINAIVAATKP